MWAFFNLAYFITIVNCSIRLYEKIYFNGTKVIISVTCNPQITCILETKDFKELFWDLNWPKWQKYVGIWQFILSFQNWIIFYWTCSSIWKMTVSVPEHNTETLLAAILDTLNRPVEFATVSTIFSPVKKLSNFVEWIMDTKH